MDKNNSPKLKIVVAPIQNLGQNVKVKTEPAGRRTSERIIIVNNSIPQIDVANTSLGVLLAFYNTHSGKPPVKRFADRKTAERRVNELLGNLPAASSVTPPVVNTQQKDTAPMATEKKTPKAKKPKAAPKAKLTKEQRAKAVSNTWSDPKVAKARAQHHNVSVAGEVYRSVKAAFEALKLPLGRHIPFRALVKANGAATFEHKEKKFNFKLVPKEK